MRCRDPEALKDGTLILYDVTSSHLEGRCCPLAAFGHNRDRKAGRMQIVYGLLCSADGCPVAVEVFEGSTSDPAAVSRSARAKARTRRTGDGLPVHGMDSLLADLATPTLNGVAPSERAGAMFLTTARPTPLQARALGLVGLDPEGPLTAG